MAPTNSLCCSRCGIYSTDKWYMLENITLCSRCYERKNQMEAERRKAVKRMMTELELPDRDWLKKPEVGPLRKVPAATAVASNLSDRPETAPVTDWPRKMMIASAKDWAKKSATVTSKDWPSKPETVTSRDFTKKPETVTSKDWTKKPETVTSKDLSRKPETVTSMDSVKKPVEVLLAQDWGKKQETAPAKETDKTMWKAPMKIPWKVPVLDSVKNPERHQAKPKDPDAGIFKVPTKVPARAPAKVPSKTLMKAPAKEPSKTFVKASVKVPASAPDDEVRAKTPPRIKKDPRLEDLDLTQEMPIVPLLGPPPFSPRRLRKRLVQSIAKKKAEESANSARTRTQKRAKLSKTGRSRRHIFKQNPTKATNSTLAIKTVDSLFHKDTYYQRGDIVSMVDKKNNTYYAQIYGLMIDTYCQKSAVIQWLLPSTLSPPPSEGFDPATYILGPLEDSPRSLHFMTFVMHAPSDYFMDVNNPYPKPHSYGPSSTKQGENRNYVWAHIGSVRRV